MGTGKAILIVEDHTMIGEYLASVLAAAGFEPIQAASLAQARELLAQRRFDLWLCDRHLPDGDSSDLLSWRGQDAHAAATPAIALSAELGDDDRRRLLAAGFIEALAKPCTPERLLAAVEQALAATAMSRSTDPKPATPVAHAITASMPVLDDAAALRMCGGDRGSLTALRRLLLAELPKLRRLLHAPLETDGNNAALSDELHRLAAAAAWCGAIESGACGATLRAALNGDGDIERARAALEHALDRLTLALA